MSLTPLADALAAMLAGVMPLGREDVGLRFAEGRTLAQAVEARTPNPPFDSSAMDGYAVIAADCTTAPARLTLIGQAAAGHPFRGAVAHGQTVRIFTGAKLPDGADAVVIQEDARADGASVDMLTPARREQNVRRRGQDFHDGDYLIAAGRCISARDILVAGAGGHATVSALKRPVVAILATGDELVAPGGELADGQIYASNCYPLAALAETAGAVARMLGIARDNRKSLADALRDGEGADILVTIGGASVGDHDLVRPALIDAGATLDVYKIAMRPGKPLFFGSRTIGGKQQRILGLPGNPVSAMVTARVFLVPLIARMLGQDRGFGAVDAALSAALPANGPRTHFMRAMLNEATSPPTVAALDNQDSSLTRAFAEANALIVVEPDAPPAPAGAVVKTLKLDF